MKSISRLKHPASVKQPGLITARPRYNSPRWHFDCEEHFISRDQRSSKHDPALFPTPQDVINLPLQASTNRNLSSPGNQATSHASQPAHFDSKAARIRNYEQDSHSNRVSIGDDVSNHEGRCIGMQSDILDQAVSTKDLCQAPTSRAKQIWTTRGRFGELTTTAPPGCA